MKIADLKQLHTKTEEELRVLLNELKETLFKAKMDLNQNKLKNTRKLRELRDDIARILTVLKMKKKGGSDA